MEHDKSELESELRRTVFVSHSSSDDDLVERLTSLLNDRSYVVNHDNNSFDFNQPLPSQIRRLIDAAGHVVVLVSPEASDSDWVKREIEYAGKVEVERPEFHIIPLLLASSSTTDLREVFKLAEPDSDTPLEDYPEEKLAIPVPGDPPLLDHVIRELVRRIEGQGGPGGRKAIAREVSELADLVLRLEAPEMKLVASKEGAEVRRPVARASLAFYPPNAKEPSADSAPFEFIAPLGKVEAADLRFYLHRYLITPFGEFTKRKERIEANFPDWGGDLYDALKPEDHTAVIEPWQQHTADQRRFTIQAPPAPRRVREGETDPQNSEATAEILALPWELVHDGRSYLFLDGKGVRVRRALPGVRKPPAPKPEHLKPPLRVLIVCSRPEDDSARYIDHRVSVRPVIEALNSLGELAAYDILAPATFKNLKKTLRDALKANRPYHIVHFDGHGVFRKGLKSGAGGLGMLVFEAEDKKLTKRPVELIGADRIGAELSNQGVQLFFLEACESAQSEETADASVAGRLLQSGIASVAAMSHTVLVETARQFTAAFYPSLVEGHRIGSAMLEGQQVLAEDRQRGYAWEPGENPGDPVTRTPLMLDDWFVPVLFQHLEDPPILTEPAPPEDVRREIAKSRELAMGAVPGPPEHAFVGRSRELLSAERLLIEQDEAWILFRGEGGEGKTTIAAELARWLVETRRMPRAAFASVEHIDAPRSVLWEWGSQLIPKFGAQAGDSEQSALDLLVKILRDRPAVLILDNLETILPPPEDFSRTGLPARSPETPASRPNHTSEGTGLETHSTSATAYEPTLQQDIFALCRRILDEAPGAKLILTSREAPPEDSGFTNRRNRLEIGRLGPDEAIELVARVLATRQRDGEPVDPKALEAEKEADIQKLVDLVGGHARSLVLLTPELAERGLTATTEELVEILEEMDQREDAGRETSLLASMELSLRRLPAGVREKLRPLGVVQGGGCLLALQDLVEFEMNEFLQVAIAMDQVGLADLQALTESPNRPDHFFLAFDPALAPALLAELRRDPNPEAEPDARRRNAEAYRRFAGFLYQQKSKEAQLVSRLTLLELSNLLAALRWIAADALPPGREESKLKTENRKLETLIDFDINLEQLVKNFNRPAALREAGALRARAAERLGDTWSHSAYLAMQQQTEHLLSSGQIPQALQSAETVVQRAEMAGVEVYPDAAYDLAYARWIFGRALRMARVPGKAFPEIETARQSFEALAAGGDENAARMASLCLSEAADCHVALGQLDEAARNFEESINRATNRGDLRSVAVNTSQLATVRLQQQEYAEALRLYHEAREIFETLGESTAQPWHQIGRIHEQTGKFEAAEEASLKSLAMDIKFKNTRGEAESRGQLGNLYSRMPGRQEESIAFCRQAAEIFAELGLAMEEGAAHNNVANTLLKLARYDEARTELTRALECLDPFGHNAQPWKTSSILEKLETAAGNAEAARDARDKSMVAYEAARRDGWQVIEGTQRYVVMAGQALQSGDPEVAESLQTQLLPQLAQTDDPENVALGDMLGQLLAGSRDPALAEHPELFHRDAVEVKLLLEELAATGK